MTDPASLNVTLRFTGLSANELGALLVQLPSRARFSGAATRPAIGATRYELSVQDVSIQAASDLTGTLLTLLSEA